MTWTLVGDQAVNTKTGEVADALWGDALPAARDFLEGHALEKEFKNQKEKSMALLCGYLPAHERAYVPAENKVITHVEYEDSKVDLAAFRIKLGKAELELNAWRDLALAAKGYSFDKLRTKAAKELAESVTTNGWVNYIRIDGVEE